MSPEQLITLFKILFYVFIVITAAGFGWAAFSFFRFRIPTVYALMTGRAQRKTVEQMRASGVLRTDEELAADKLGANADVFEPKTEDYMTEQVSNLKADNDNQYMTQKISAETTVLQPESATTVLQPELATTVLGGAADTTVLNRDTQTTVLKPDTETFNMEQDTFTSGEDRTVDFGETTILNAEADAQNKVTMNVIEHIMIIHTDESI